MHVQVVQVHQKQCRMFGQIVAGVPVAVHDDTSWLRSATCVFMTLYPNLCMAAPVGCLQTYVSVADLVSTPLLHVHRAAPEQYSALIRAGDSDAIMELLTDRAVEAKVTQVYSWKRMMQSSICVIQACYGS